MIHRRGQVVAAVVAIAALGVASPCAAQNDAAAAEKLFREGRLAFERKDYETACPKLAESERLDPASGTALALAACHEMMGKTASAWAEYNEAISLAKHDGNLKREKVAAQRAAAVEPKLLYVTIRVSPATADLVGLEIKRDGVPIGRAAWNDSPIDPGEHELGAVAPGKKPFAMKFTVTERHTLVDVPALADVPLPPPPPGPPPSDPGPTMRIAGVTFAGTGAVALGIGLGLGAAAISASNHAKSVCTPALCQDPKAVADNDGAKTKADWSTALVIGGTLGLAGGAALYFLAPKPKAVESARLSLGPGPGDVGASIGGTFR